MDSAAGPILTKTFQARAWKVVRATVGDSTRTPDGLGPVGLTELAANDDGAGQASVNVSDTVTMATSGLRIPHIGQNSLRSSKPQDLEVPVFLSSTPALRLVRLRRRAPTGSLAGSKKKVHDFRICSSGMTAAPIIAHHSVI